MVEYRNFVFTDAEGPERVNQDGIDTLHSKFHLGWFSVVGILQTRSQDGWTESAIEQCYGRLGIEILLLYCVLCIDECIALNTS